MKDWAAGYARCYLVGEKADITRAAAGEARRKRVFAMVDEDGAELVKGATRAKSGGVLEGVQGAQARGGGGMTDLGLLLIIARGMATLLAIVAIIVLTVAKRP